MKFYFTVFSLHLHLNHCLWLEMSHKFKLVLHEKHPKRDSPRLFVWTGGICTPGLVMTHDLD